ncbi:MAG: hypothetical protein RLY87_2798 [Chloroflexota bacterium]
MKDDTIHTQDTQTRFMTNAFLTLSHRAVASYIVQCLRQHAAVIAVGKPAIAITATHAWQGIQLDQLSHLTVLVTLAAECDVAHERSQLSTLLATTLGQWLEQSITVDVHVTALAPDA